MKIAASNVCLEFQMEVEQRPVVSYLHRKDMKLPEIFAELPSVCREEAFDENAVQYWFHGLKLHRSGLGHRPSSSRPSLKMPMPEFCKSQKLSHGLLFER
jgi:hypothetical protein